MDDGAVDSGPQPGHLRSVAAILGAAVLFGTTGTAQELGPAGATPLGVGAIRILVGALALWVIAGRRPRPARIGRQWRTVAAGAFGLAVYQPGFFAGTDRLGVALGTIVALGSGPVFAGALVWIGGRRPSATWAAATVLAVAGGTLLVLSGEAGAEFDLVGLAGSLSAGLGYAVYAIATKRLIDHGVHSTEASAWQFSIAAATLAPLLATQPLGWLATGGGALMALHLGVLTIGVAYLLYGWGLRTVETSTAVTLTLAEPITAALAALVVLDERLRGPGWIGAALVLAGLALAGGGTRPRPGRRRPPVARRADRDVG